MGGGGGFLDTCARIRLGSADATARVLFSMAESERRPLDPSTEFSWTASNVVSPAASTVSAAQEMDKDDQFIVNSSERHCSKMTSFRCTCRRCRWWAGGCKAALRDCGGRAFAHLVFLSWTAVDTAPWPQTPARFRVDGSDRTVHGPHLLHPQHTNPKIRSRSGSHSHHGAQKDQRKTGGQPSRVCHADRAARRRSGRGLQPRNNTRLVDGTSRDSASDPSPISLRRRGFSCRNRRSAGSQHEPLEIVK